MLVFNDYENELLVSVLSKDLLNYIDSRHREILELRYLKGLTLREVGKSLGITPERVRQVESKALRIIRTIMLKEEREIVGIRKISLKCNDCGEVFEQEYSDSYIRLCCDDCVVREFFRKYFINKEI